MGFGTCIADSRNNQKKGPMKLIKRVFECVHAGKPASFGETSNTSESIAEDVSSKNKKAGVEMDVTDARQRNRMLHHDCKAQMIVGLRNDRWTVTYFVAQYTHNLVQQVEHTRYYRSHRKI